MQYCCLTAGATTDHSLDASRLHPVVGHHETCVCTHHTKFSAEPAAGQYSRNIFLCHDFCTFEYIGKFWDAYITQARLTLLDA